MYIVHVSHEGAHCHTDINKIKIKKECYLKVPLHRRMFCDGHIMLVFCGVYTESWNILEHFCWLLLENDRGYYEFWGHFITRNYAQNIIKFRPQDEQYQYRYEYQSISLGKFGKNIALIFRITQPCLKDTEESLIIIVTR